MPSPGTPSQQRDQPDPIPCVGAVVHDNAGRLLLVRRGTEPGLGQWSIPGGRVEPGEDDHGAVLRELAEETGVTGVVARLLGEVRRDAPDGRTYVIRDYLVHPAAAEDPTPGDDAEAANWVTAAEMAALPLVPQLWEALAEWGALPR